MTSSAGPPVDRDASDAVRAAGLRRIKAIATATLAASLVLFVIAKVVARRHPAFEFVAAFFEAASIGGLADWFAVVAMFRHPLGLPIPHTAVIPTNRDRIANKMGEFVEIYFLAPEPIEAELRKIDFARLLADWLADAKGSTEAVKHLMQGVASALAAAQTSGLQAFLNRNLVKQVQSIDLAPLAAGLVRHIVRDGRHHALLDDILVAIDDAMNERQTLRALRAKIRAELPSVLNYYSADIYLLKRLMASSRDFLDEVRADPEHPLRGEIDRMLEAFADKLETDPLYADRLAGMKRSLLDDKRLNDLAGGLWMRTQSFVERLAARRPAALQRQLAGVRGQLRRLLAEDEAIRARINAGVVIALGSAIAAQRHGIAQFISGQAKSWDIDRLVKVIELNVGKDLQYIRFNGALIGGLVGLLFYTVDFLLHHL